MKKIFLLLLSFIIISIGIIKAQSLKDTTVPVVILGFDDAVLDQLTTVAPLLKKYGFDATFYVCEFPVKLQSNSKYYMKWPQIKQLYNMGFEIGNHTHNHKNLTKLSPDEARKEIAYIENKCKEYGIPKPISLAYPGNRTDLATQAIVKQMGYHYARAGGSKLYDPGKESRYAIPSYTMGSSEKLKPRTEKVLSQLKPGQILAFTIHGVPYYPHPAYSTTPKDFETFLKYMKEHHFKVIAMRDLDALLRKN